MKSAPILRRDRPSHQPIMVMRHGRLVRNKVVAEGVDETRPDSAGDESGAKLSSERVGAFSKFAIALFVVSLCLPFQGSIGPMRLMPSTAYLLLGFIPAFLVVISKRQRPFCTTDLLLIGFWFWATIAIIYNHGVAFSIEPVAMHLLQTVGAYMVGRALVHNAVTMRHMIKWCVFVLVVTLPLVLFESATRINLILKVAQMTGASFNPEDMGMRFGLTRAQAYFNHPILFGVFCASMMSLIFYGLSRSSLKTRISASAVAFVCSVTSLSAGALLSLNIQFGLMAWSRLFRNMRYRWYLLAGLLLAAYIAVDTVSTRTPFHTFVRYATFSNESSYTRILIWTFGMQNVAEHPIFGIGFNDWVRPDFMGTSIDNFWLLHAMRYGLPAFFLLFLAFVATLIRMGKRERTDSELYLMRRGVSFSFIATIVALFTVHLWNAPYMWVMFLLGASTWLSLPPPSLKAVS